MSEIQAIEQAIAAMEAQRSLLGDSTVDTVLAPLREKLQDLKTRQKSSELQLKYVSVLFTDIVSSTQIGQQLDPEDTMEIMNSALMRFDQVIQQHGGRVTRFMGDGLKAVFGIPTALEDDAERAVKAGLALVQTAKEYARHVEETWGLGGFNIRVGINTGQIVIGSGVEEENTAMGIAINLGARMESAAPVGGVLISENTYHHVRGLFELLARPLIKVKGIDLPVQTYEVLSSLPWQFHAAGRGIAGARSVMVGRDTELDSLRSFFLDILQAPRARLITILGEAGVGKSRLVLEFESWAVTQSCQPVIYRSRSVSQNRVSPYHLLRDLFADAFDILESDPAEQARLKLENGLVRFLGEEAQMKAHIIGALLGYDFSASLHVNPILSQPRQINQRGLYYLEQYFENTTRDGIALLLLEDIHWADSPSLEFIQRMAGSLGDHRLLVICSARNILLESYPDYPLEDAALNAEYLQLQPLDGEHCRMLVESILAPLRPMPPSLLDLIVKQAEGNPYYVEELINMLIDDGIIQTSDKDADWKVNTARLNAMRIPRTLTAVLQARLDGLPLAEKRLMQQASVIGRTFWDLPLQLIQVADRTPDDELASLSRRRLIHPNPNSTFQQAREYAFRQTALHDVAYETVLKRDRQRYHAAVAAWLSQITQASGRSEEHLALIAEHYEKAGDTAQAASWYLRAGDRAKAQGAPLQARHFFDRALELLPESQSEQRWLALSGRDEVFGILGMLEAREQDEQVLLRMALNTGNHAWLSEAYRRIGFTASLKGDERTALQSYEASIASAREIEDAKVEAQTLSLATISLTRLGEMERAREYAVLALERANLAGDEINLAKVTTNVAAHYSETGDFCRATELFLQQITLTHRMRERTGEAIGHVNIGYNYVQMGMYSTARKHLEEALRLCELIGARLNRLYAQLNLGLVLYRSQEISAALQVLESASDALSATGDQFGFAAALMYRGLAHEAAGELAQAVQLFNQSYEIYAKIEMFGLAFDSSAGIVRCSLAGYPIESTCRNAEEIWEYLEKQRGEGMEFPILAYLTCCDASAACGKAEIAHEIIEAGCQELKARAARISDPQWQQAYLENVPEHARILAAYKARLSQENQPRS